jgi:hypothetical protein
LPARRWAVANKLRIERDFRARLRGFCARFMQRNRLAKSTALPHFQVLISARSVRCQE